MFTYANTLFGGIEAPCCIDVPDDACECSEGMRVLRAYAGEGPCHRSMPPMTDEQRRWCLEEIEEIYRHLGKRFSKPSDDGELAQAVLKAWDEWRD